MYQNESRDRVVEAILALVRKEPADPELNRQAIVRAGLIAQAYSGCDPDLLRDVFGSGSHNVLQHDNDDDTSAASTGAH